MAKKTKLARNAKKSRKKVATKRQILFAKLRRFGWVILAVVLASLVLLISYVFRPEDLGPQLPPPPADALYKQPDQPIEARVTDLIGRMTLEEKIGQMALVDKNSLVKVEDISKYYLGGVLSGAGAQPDTNSAQGWLNMVSSMKKQAAESRLGIPLLYGIDANHGHANVLGATVFPHAIGLGASGDSALVHAVARATAQELNATGINWSYSPSLDAPKDIRWGRVYEGFSDDPDLNGVLGSAFVAGTQTGLESGTNVLAAAKHYLGTGAMVWGQSNHKTFKIDQGKIVADDVALANEYLPPYKAVIDAGVSSVMVGLSQWGKDRIIDSKYLVTTKLKDELGFKGFVVSDWYGVYEYSGTSTYQANIKTINAGLDMAMLPYDYKTFLKETRTAIRSGKISQSRIDDAVSRILYQKFKAGLFDTGTQPNQTKTVGSDKHRSLARQAVASSAVLLKNSEALLPLAKNSGRILVAGTGADNVGRQCGAWTVEWQGVDGNWMPGGTSILEGIRQVVGASSVVDYDKDGYFAVTDKADVGIVVISEKPYAEGWGDNPNPTLDTVDQQTIDRVKKSSKKLVVVMVSGRPLMITQQLPVWDAVVAAWLPGSEGGGVADVLFGDKPFTGRLPLPWPANVTQLPISSEGQTNNGSEPLFKRGHGL